MDFDRYMTTTSKGKLIPTQKKIGWIETHYPSHQWSNYRCVPTNSSLMKLVPGTPAQTDVGHKRPMSRDQMCVTENLSEMMNCIQYWSEVTFKSETVLMPLNLTPPIIFFLCVIKRSLCSWRANIIHLFFCSFLHLQFGNPHSHSYNGSGKSVP